MTGRPSNYSEEIAEELCDALADGMSLRAWCEEPGHPRYSTVFQWLRKEPAFAEAYAHAREVQAHNDADRITQVMAACADLRLPADVTRVVVDALKWTAARRLPKVYAERPPPGTDDGAPLVVRWADGSE